MTDSDYDYRELPLATVTFPREWEDVTQLGADFAAAPSSGWSIFRPSFVVTSVEAAVGIDEASAVTMTAEQQRIPGTNVVACDVWPHQDVPGRRIELFYPAEDYTVLVSRWIWSTGTHLVHATASRLPHQAESLDPVFSYLASSLRITT